MAPAGTNDEFGATGIGVGDGDGVGVGVEIKFGLGKGVDAGIGVGVAVDEEDEDRTVEPSSPPEEQLLNAPNEKTEITTAMRIGIYLFLIIDAAPFRINFRTKTVIFDSKGNKP